MSLHKLRKMAFTALIPRRRKMIERAYPRKMPELTEYKANRLAKALHPKVQNVYVSEVIEINSDTKSFILKPDVKNGTESLAYFSAGQHISVRIKIGQTITSRPFTISSSPKESLEGFYRITVKRVKGGFVSDYILNNWEKGTSFVVSQPLGTFTYEPLRDAKNLVCVAGGSGITPFISLAKAVRDGDEKCNLTILFGSRNRDEILFRKELDQLEKECDRIKVVHVLSEDEKEGFEKGFITADLIGKYSPEGEYSIFICGPKAMYDFLKVEVEKLGLRRKFVRFEVMGEYRNPEEDDAFPKEKEGRYLLTVLQDGKKTTVSCCSKEPLMVSMEKAGLVIASSCRSGQCGWCHSRLISGEVYIPQIADGRRMADAQFGYIHTCVAFPVSDLEIEVPVIYE